MTPKQKADLESRILGAQLNLKQGYPKVAAVQLEAALQALEVVDSAKAVGEPVAWMNPNESFSRDAFLWARDEDCSPEYNVPVFAAPASPAASVLSDEKIDGFVIGMFGKDRFHFAPDVWRDFARALLAASMGGEKS